MNWLIRLIMLSVLALTGACSMEGAINRMTSAEDRAFAFGFVDHVRRGTADRLEPRFDPELWAKSREQLSKARPLFPPGEGETKLVSYHFETNLTDGSRESRKEYILVTTDRTHWTRTRLITWGKDGPSRIVEWNVEGLGEPPPELKLYETMEAAAPWIQGVALLLLISAIALVWWLVRRSRRRAAELP